MIDPVGQFDSARIGHPHRKIDTCAHYVTISATIAGANGDHSGSVQRKCRSSSVFRDPCSDRCIRLRGKPVIRYIDHYMLEVAGSGSSVRRLKAAFEAASGRRSAIILVSPGNGARIGEHQLASSATAALIGGDGVSHWGDGGSLRWRRLASRATAATAATAARVRGQWRLASVGNVRPRVGGIIRPRVNATRALGSSPRSPDLPTT
jgi:hypothetical protein